MKMRPVLIPLLTTCVLAISSVPFGYAAEKSEGRGQSGYARRDAAAYNPMVIKLAAAEREDGEDHGEGERRGEKERFMAPESPLYRKECSSCHFLYQPGLLPARSWARLIKTSDRHFGEDLALEEKTREDLRAYLTANSAEKSDAEWSAKIMRSVGASTPERITRIPYIAREHRKIRPAVFKRPAIKSFSNCGACHTKGAEGNFEERTVVIPK